MRINQLMYAERTNLPVGTIIRLCVTVLHLHDMSFLFPLKNAAENTRKGGGG